MPRRCPSREPSSTSPPISRATKCTSRCYNRNPLQIKAHRQHCRHRTIQDISPGPDRKKRQRHAVYVTAEMQSSRLTSSVVADSALEIEWVRVGESVFIAALYHLPRPTYKLGVLLNYIEVSVAELSHDFPLAEIVVAGDVNQLSERGIVDRTRLMQTIYQPTRGANTLDSPQLFNTVRVVASVVKSDHKAVVAFPDSTCQMPKTHRQRVYRWHTQHSTPSSFSTRQQGPHKPATNGQLRPSGQRTGRIRPF